MANYIYTNGNLYNAESLAHAYKYIKKVPNGKGGFTYIYDDSYVRKADRDLDVAERKSMAADWKHHLKRKELEKSIPDLNPRVHLGDEIDAYREKERANKEYNSAFKRRRNAYLKNATVGTIAKGAVKVANLLAKYKKKKKEKIF